MQAYPTTELQVLLLVWVKVLFLLSQWGHLVVLFLLSLLVRIKILFLKMVKKTTIMDMPRMVHKMVGVQDQMSHVIVMVQIVLNVVDPVLLLLHGDGMLVKALQTLVVVMITLKAIDPPDEIVMIVAEETVAVAVQLTVTVSVAQLAGTAVRLHRDTAVVMKNGLAATIPFRRAISKVRYSLTTTKMKQKLTSL